MKAETKWASIIAVSVFLLLMVEMLLGLHAPEQYNSWLWVDLIAGSLIFISGFWFLLREKQEEKYGGLLTWRQGFWSGAVATLLLLPLSTLLVFIFINWINPAFPLVFAEKTGHYDYHIDPTGIFLSSHVISGILFGLLLALVLPIFLTWQRQNH